MKTKEEIMKMDKIKNGMLLDVFLKIPKGKLKKMFRELTNQIEEEKKQSDKYMKRADAVFGLDEA